MKAIFLDRDGVINRYPGDTKYVTTWREFRFLPRAKKAITQLYKEKYKIFVISNQAGVNKGILSLETLNRITENMLREIKKSGGKIEAVFYCIHRKEENCSCRKPKAGMLYTALKKYRFNLKKTYFVGDTIRDIQTAKEAGCKSVLVLCGKERLSNYKSWGVEPDFIFSDLYETVKFILKPKK